MEIYVGLGVAALAVVGFIVWDAGRLRRVRRRQSPLDDKDMPRPGYGGSLGDQLHRDAWGGDRGGSSGGDGGGSGGGTG